MRLFIIVISSTNLLVLTRSWRIQAHNIIHHPNARLDLNHILSLR
jgi:hypothetical protein